MYPTAWKILRSARGLDACKLLFAQAALSKPVFAPVLTCLLRLFSPEEDFKVKFVSSAGNLPLKAFFRLRELASDMESFREVGMGDCYRIATMNFEPELVVDGGGNTGLFTLSAFRKWPNAKFLIFEPLTENVIQIEKNLAVNNCPAEILSCALGSTAGDATFYKRAANQGGLAPDAPYTGTARVKVCRLSERIDVPADAKCLIKLDIEGAEVDVIEELLKAPRPHTVVVGELHFGEKQKQRLIEVIRRANWEIHFQGLGENSDIFLARPANTIFKNESEVEAVATSHGSDLPTRKKVLLPNGIVPHVTQIATSVSWDECDTSKDAHTHKTMYEIYFIRSGHAIFTIGGEAQNVGPGGFVVVPPNTYHAYKVAPGETLKLFYFGIATD